MHFGLEIPQNFILQAPISTMILGWIQLHACTIEQNKISLQYQKRLPSRLGGTTPRCLKALSMATRPREVRWI